MGIFDLAFFPQFVNPAEGSEIVQMLVLDAVFWIVGAIWDLAFARASGTIGIWLQRRPSIQAARPRVEGSAYVALAGWAAITGTRIDDHASA